MNAGPLSASQRVGVRGMLRYEVAKPGGGRGAVLGQGVALCRPESGGGGRSGSLPKLGSCGSGLDEGWLGVLRGSVPPTLLLSAKAISGVTSRYG